MKTRVLVVDDSAAMRSLLGSVVKSLGYEPFVAESGEVACEIFEKEAVDIAVLDVEMPGINGFETCRRIRELANSWFPVIYLSGTSSDEYIIEGLDAGGDAYVAKPLNPRVLESILKAMGRIADMKEQLELANGKLEEMARLDALTQIPNRRHFDEIIERYNRQSKRADSTLALLLLDIDHFKQYNDTYGHQPGDECIQKVAKALTKAVQRPGDMVFRYGGEEFAILLPETDAEGAMLVGENALKKVQELELAHSTSSVAEIVTISAGIASSQAGALSIEALVEAADKNLYKAKEAGRNNVKAG